MKRFEDEIKNCYIDNKFNSRLLSKDVAKEIAKGLIDSQPYYENNGYLKPINHNEVIDEIFSLDNVFLVKTPCQYIFDKFGNYLREICTTSKSSFNKDDAVQDIKNQLNEGYIIYFYLYYSMRNDERFFWRYFKIKE